MTRRGFFSASAALAALPALGRLAWGAPLPRDAADIVVIGAGAAGIAAARRIVAANRKVVVVEASSIAEAVATRPRRKMVIKAGRVIARDGALVS